MEEAGEEFTGSNDQTLIVKGKRTKRPRPSSPFGAATATSTSSSAADGGCSSGEISTCTEEDEDMANCLILLAQGNCSSPTKVEDDATGKIDRKFISSPATATAGKSGFYVYECKTCNRTFPSFQALGGHRASHKKPKITITEEQRPAGEEDDEGQFSKISPPLSLQSLAPKTSNFNPKPKVHECSICGSEFSSGQALGGHMRRHRAPAPNPSIMDTGNPRQVLQLDLNLPAPPEDDHQRDPKFEFIPSKEALVFSAPALVGCHY